MSTSHTALTAGDLRPRPFGTAGVLTRPSAPLSAVERGKLETCPTKGAPIAPRTAGVLPDDGTDGGTEDEPWDAPEPPPLPPPRAFSLAALPAWLRDFAEAEAAATGTAPDLSAVLALASLSAACAGKFRVETDPGVTEPLGLSLAVAVAPGMGHERVFRDFARPLVEWDRAESSRGAAAFDEYVAVRRCGARVVRDSTRSIARIRIGVELGDERRFLDKRERISKMLAALRPPAVPHKVVDARGGAALAPFLCDHGGRLAVFSPDGGILESLARSRGGDEGPSLSDLLAGRLRDRLSDRECVGPGGSPIDVTVALAIDPEIVRNLPRRAAAAVRRLLRGFLFALPPSTLGRRAVDPPPVPDPVRRRYANNIVALARLPAPASPDDDPIALTLSPDSRQELLTKVRAAVEPALGPGGNYAGMAGWASGLPAAMCRVAALLHLADFADAPPDKIPREIGVEVFARARSLGQSFVEHGAGAFGTLGLDPAVENATRIRDWVVRKAILRFSERDLYHALSEMNDPANREQALEVLVGNGDIREAEAPMRDGPGRKPGPAYEVNPSATEGSR